MRCVACPSIYIYSDLENDAYLLEVEVYNRDEVKGVRVVVVVWITIAVIQPQLDQPAFTWHHVNCMTA